MEVIGVIVASVAALGAIIWKVVTRKEGTTLPGITKFDPKRIPIFLTFAENMPIEVITCTRDAAKFWNSTLEHTLFTLELMPGGSTVPIMPFSGNESARRQKKAVAYVDLTLTEDRQGIKSASVKVDTDKIVNMLPVAITLVMAHEFGHVLGLEHDDEYGSIMYSKAGERGAYVTPLDKRIILSEYGLA